MVPFRKSNHESNPCLVLVVEVLLGLELAPAGLVAEHGAHLVGPDALPHDVGDGGGDQAEMDRQVHPARERREKRRGGAREGGSRYFKSIGRNC